MKRTVLTICCALHLACASAASPTDDMIEASEEALLFVDSVGVTQLLDSVDAYAHSIGLTGSRETVHLKEPFAILSGYETPFESEERPRSIYVLHNCETRCVKVTIRVWDDQQTNEAERLKVELASLLQSEVGVPVRTIAEDACKLPF